jgi:hypothetical protein
MQGAWDQFGRLYLHANKAGGVSAGLGVVGLGIQPHLIPKDCSRHNHTFKEQHGVAEIGMECEIPSVFY